MPPEKDLENQDDLAPESDQVTDTEDTQQSSETTEGKSPKENWEARYKGLQKVVAKKDQDIESLQQQIDKFASELEELRNTSGSLEVDKKALAGKLEEIQNQFNQTQQERDRLQSQLERQNIIVKSFPDIAPLADFIPPADSLEQFEANAKNLQEAVQQMVEQRTTEVIKGGTPTLPRETGEEMTSTSQEDKLWSEVYRLAGVPGKEQEYEEKRQLLVNLMQSKGN